MISLQYGSSILSASLAFTLFTACGDDAGGSMDSTDSMADATDAAEANDTSDTGEPGLPVELGDAGDFVILAKSGISTVPGSVVTGDLGLSPAAATYLTGFSLSVDATNTFADLGPGDRQRVRVRLLGADAGQADQGGRGHGSRVHRRRRAGPRLH